MRKKLIPIFVLCGILLSACGQDQHLYSCPQVTELLQSQLPEGVRVYASVPRKFGEDERMEDVLQDTEYVHAAVYISDDFDPDSLFELFRNSPITGKIEVKVYNQKSGTSGSELPSPAELVKSFTIQLK